MKCLYALLAGSATVTLAAVPAMAQEVRSQVEVRAGAGYQSNPFFEGQGAGNAGPTTSVEVDPRILITDEDSRISINGNARLDYFLDDGRTNDSISIRTDAQQRMSERLELNGAASFLTSRNALFDAIFDDPAALTDDQFLPDPIIIDGTVAGQQIRTTIFQITGGGNYQLSPVSSLNGEITSNWTEFDGGFGNSFASTGGTVGYARVISPRTTLSVQGDLSFSRFDGIENEDEGVLGLGGDAVLAGASVAAQIQLSQTGRLNVQAGFTTVRTDFDVLEPQTSTFASGNVSFCERVLGGSLCLNGSRQVQNTGAGGLAPISTVGIGWSSELSPYDSVSLSARYSVAEQPEVGIGGLFPERGTTRLFGINPSYRRRISDDLRVFLEANYADISGALLDSNEVYGLRVGIAKMFGEVR
ncbi:MAG: hypothetical protein V2J51_08340 [Erythrobacter sp.]|jgi:hypothetical protein|nr:hypothetical protein [Erythrobacter sp.]